MNVYGSLVESIRLVHLNLSHMVVFSVLSLSLHPPLAYAGPGSSPEVGDSMSMGKALEMPARLQWRANYGYCGEVALISAGLYYGQYVSQFDARAIASKGADQSTEESQFLLGVNDTYAAAPMHLKTSAWEGDASSSTKDFLRWVKDNIVSGHPVIIGVYMNRHLFYGTDDLDAGDEEYDHIVPVRGVTSRHSLQKPSIYYDDDVLTFSDNGLWAGNGAPAFMYSYSFKAFQANRTEANLPSGAVYALPRTVGNYGIAVTGIIDKDGQTLPVRLTTNVNDEKPAMKEGSNIRPASSDITLTVKVSGLEPGTSYNLYRYSDFKSVPDSAFNAKAKKADKSWKIVIDAGSTYSMNETIKSNQVAIYRAVPATAP
jgi:hypothetical protein